MTLPLPVCVCVYECVHVCAYVCVCVHACVRVCACPSYLHLSPSCVSPEYVTLEITFVEEEEGSVEAVRRFFPESWLFEVIETGLVVHL